MYISSIISFTTSWLFLCLIIPLYSGAERSYGVPSDWKMNDPVHHQFRPIQFRPGSVPSRLSSEDSHSKGNVKQNMARPMPKYQLGEIYRPYYYTEFQFVGNRGTPKEESAARLEPRYEESREIDEEILKKMNVLDKLLSEDTDKSDVELKNTVEDGIIAETSISEETKRVVRQVRRQRPGFFWTLARLAFETYNDTRSAIQQISNIINQNIEPDPRPPVSSHPLMVVDARTLASSNDQSTMSNDTAGVNTTTTMTTTTTPAPFKLTPTGLQNLIRRNLRGLVRLFNIEWQDAVNQTEVSIREFQKNLGTQVGSFLQDNPNAF